MADSTYKHKIGQEVENSAPTPSLSTEVANKEHTEGSIDTGTVLSLGKTAGTNYNYAAASTSLSYTTANLVVNGYAKVLINASSEPVVYLPDGTTPATKISGATFAASTNMELVVESVDGVNVRYFFLEL